MPLEEFLFPGEAIKYQSGKCIRYGGNEYVLYITDRRILGHNRRGLIFKKDQVFSAAFEQVRNLSYREKGTVRKTGVLVLQTIGQTLHFEGNTEEVKVIFQEMQQFLGHAFRRGAEAMAPTPPPPPPTPTTTYHTKEIVYKEIVRIRCPYCKHLVPQDAMHCTECGAAVG